MFRFFGRTKNSSTSTNTNNLKPNNLLIDVRHVRKTFKTAAGDFHALKGVDLRIQRGEFVGIVGKSGSGKSTLMNMITGIDRPSAGDVYVNQTHLNDMSEAQMAKWRGVNIGVIFQFFQLLPTLTVVENVMLPMDFCNMYTPKERRERAMHLLETVDIAHQAEKLPMMISGGQQQRVAIARSLANDAPLIIADEPTGNLDSKTASQVFHFFDSLVKAGKTFVMVTHDHDMASQLGRVVTIADGEILDDTGSKVVQPVQDGAEASVYHDRVEQEKASSYAVMPNRFDQPVEVMV